MKDFSSEIGSAKIADEPPDWPTGSCDDSVYSTQVDCESASGTWTSVSPFTAAISGDLANQLMFAAWSTGVF